MAIITLALFYNNFEIAVLAAGVFHFLRNPVVCYTLHGFLQKGYLYLLLSYVRCLTNMIDGDKEPKQTDDSEPFFVRISYRPTRLYQIMQENRRKVDEERQELQSLVSDISIR